MHATTATPAVFDGTTYAPPARQALLAECLGAIIAGRPLPAEYQCPMPAVSRPASVRDGIERIVMGR